MGLSPPPAGWSPRSSAWAAPANNRERGGGHPITSTHAARKRTGERSDPATGEGQQANQKRITTAYMTKYERARGWEHERCRSRGDPLTIKQHTSV
ncbi:hypothetical protein QQF64_034290 [Cirrhinus molitorella]|uniref:MHC class I antigen n=1 Tax=Cirrhinus molitorella TaxID=172907 RepID=A0ABR3L5G7_9TELE